jgi:hypothetical protein
MSDKQHGKPGAKRIYPTEAMKTKTVRCPDRLWAIYRKLGAGKWLRNELEKYSNKA